MRRQHDDQPPYCAFDACGLRFVKWNGGGDGMIDAAQEKWIMDECAQCPKDKQLVVLVHQPSVGMCSMERDIGRVALRHPRQTLGRAEDPRTRAGVLFARREELDRVEAGRSGQGSV